MRRPFSADLAFPEDYTGMVRKVVTVANQNVTCIIKRCAWICSYPAENGHVAVLFLF